MIDIFLHKYAGTSESTTAYNAPHKFRLTKKVGMDTSMVEKTWNIGKKKVLNELIEKIKALCLTEDSLAFAVAPSSTKIFFNDIKSTLIESFPNAIDLTSCFTKINQFDAGKTNMILDEEGLRNSIVLDEECYNSKVTENINTIILIDDVFALGNTFSAMKLALSDINCTKEIKTAVILKTT